MASGRVSRASSGLISETGLASARTSGSAAMVISISGFKHVGCREAEEDVGADDGLGQRAHRRRLGVAGLVGVHAGRPALVDHAVDVGGDDVLARQAECYQEVEAGERRGTGTAGHELAVRELLLGQHQAVGDRGTDDDRGAVLVVVEDRDLHPRLELLLDDEAVGRLDVLEIDGAEGGLERGHHLDQLQGIGLGHLDVEGVDAGELLEQHGLALHHRLAGERADGAEAEDGRAVGDDGHEIAPGGQRVGGIRVIDDRLTRDGDARRIGEREVALGGERLGRDHLQLARYRKPVVIQRVALERVRHP